MIKCLGTTDQMFQGIVAEKASCLCFAQISNTEVIDPFVTNTEVKPEQVSKTH